VVGVMPPGFNFPGDAAMWLPLTITLQPNNSYMTAVLGRIRDGVTPAQATSELDAIARAMPADPRGAGRVSVASIVPLKTELTGTAEKSLLIFSGAVAFVLLIACANVANLLLIRAATRRREIAVRVALGASRARIALQVLTESLVIAVAGGAIGILVGVAGLRALLAIAPAGRIPRLDEVHPDAWVVAFTVAVSLVTGVVFGLAPALASARRQPHDALADSARLVTGSHSRLRGFLVAAEIALALVLLTGAGLLIKSFQRMRDVDKGYDPSHVTTMAVDLPATSYPDIERVRAFHGELAERLARIPGVRGVGAVTFRPMSSAGIMGDFAVEGPTPHPKGYVVDKTAVSPGYFGAMGIRVVRGRGFAPTDDAHAPLVVIVSESVARRIWPNESAIGKRISMADRPTAGDWLTVVGVVNDVVQDGSLGKHSTIYRPHEQLTFRFFVDRMTYVVRSDGLTSGVPQAMRAALREVDPNVPANAMQTMDDAMLDIVAEPVFQMRLLTAFSLLALLLAAIGTYGVMAYDVAERTREIGLRIALGATPGAVVGLIMRRGGVLALAGTAAGMLGSVAMTGVLRKSLFEVEPTDPVTIAIVAATIVAIALLAAFVPARRASRTPSLTSIAQSL
jgi:putative ABC transport system permease protein